jgi:hypothetical protein
MAFALSTTALLAANLKIEAKLIWATNDEKSPNAGHKKVEDASAERLRNAFKWKNYFVVTNVVKDIPSRGTVPFELSKKCTVEIRELEGPRVEVILIGEGKKLNKAIKPLNIAEPLVFSGDDKNQTAWFVMITELEQK